MFHLVRRPYGSQSYRANAPDQASSATPVSIMIGSAMIAVALLLSTLITAVGSRYVGFEGTTEDSAWLIDRLTGTVYRCQAANRGRAACEGDILTGSVPTRSQ